MTTLENILVSWLASVLLLLILAIYKSSWDSTPDEKAFAILAVLLAPITLIIALFVVIVESLKNGVNQNQ